MEQVSRIGMDTSKHIFQLHGVNAAERPVLRRKLRRRDMIAFFERLSPTRVAIEACGASHHWARRTGPAVPHVGCGRRRRDRGRRGLVAALSHPDGAAVRLAALVLVSTLAASPAAAHGPIPIQPEVLWQAWSFDPLVLVPLLLAHWAYGR